MTSTSANIAALVSGREQNFLLVLDIINFDFFSCDNFGFFLFFHQHLGFPIIGLEADLKDAIAEGVAVQGLDGDQALVVVGHGDEPEAFALVGLQVADHFDVLHGTKWAK